MVVAATFFRGGRWSPRVIAATMPQKITIYSRPDCHLCDLAKDVVERCRKKVDFTLEVIDISQDPALFERYRDDIPVILLDDREIARHFVRERKLLELLQQARTTTAEERSR
jgi:glutaredoxin